MDVELRICSRADSYTPDVVLKTKRVPITPGRNCIKLDFETELTSSQYAFLLFRKNPEIKLHFTSKRITGVLSVFNQVNEAVSNYGKQEPPEDIGIDAFEFWCPQRRPAGENVAIKISEPITSFGVHNITNGISRPTHQSNAWVADFADNNPMIKLSWPVMKSIKTLVLKFDTDLDHPMETVLMGHPENLMPFCVRNYKVRDEQGKIVYEKVDNYQTMNTIRFEHPLRTRSLTVEVEHPSANVPAAIFEILCYES